MQFFFLRHAKIFLGQRKSQKKLRLLREKSMVNEDLGKKYENLLNFIKFLDPRKMRAMTPNFLAIATDGLYEEQYDDYRKTDNRFLVDFSSCGC